MSRGDHPAGPAAEMPRSGPTQYRVLGEYGTHLEAERVVDRLSDQGFPVEHLRIIGTELRPMENVTGRISKGRSALGTAISRVWLGLLIGLLLGLFAPEGGWFVILLICVLIGGFWSVSTLRSSHTSRHAADAISTTSKDCKPPITRLRSTPRGPRRPPS